MTQTTYLERRSSCFPSCPHAYSGLIFGTRDPLSLLGEVFGSVACVARRLLVCDRCNNKSFRCLRGRAHHLPMNICPTQREPHAPQRTVNARGTHGETRIQQRQQRTNPNTEPTLGRHILCDIASVTFPIARGFRFLTPVASRAKIVP